jgi:hypothetical protein
VSDSPTIVAPICPVCSVPMRLKVTERFRYLNGLPRLFWICPYNATCRMLCGAHPDGTPSSTPADAETKAARNRAHEAFDALWKTDRLSRHGAYRWMQRKMGMTRDEAHIGFFDVAQCEQLIGLLEAESRLKGGLDVRR